MIPCVLIAGLLTTTGLPQAIAREGISQPLSVCEPLTNGVDSPEAVDPGAPQFSWKLTSSQRDVRQTAYQIVLSDAQGKTVWDSGKVESDSSSGVLYTGEELCSDTFYTWKVRVWDNRGEQSEFSEPAPFRVGLAKSDWTASYIWDGSENQNDFAYFRKGFRIDKPVQEAVVYTSAHNDYQLYLNGEPVGVGPARSDPYSYGQYCAYDVTDLLEQGDNAFAALAHWHGVWSDSGVNAKPAYILEARIRYEDGTSETIKTDESWKCQPTTPYIEENPVYFGFYGGVNNRASIQYDARREIPEWNTVSFDDSNWQAAQVVDRQEYNLYAQLVSEQAEMESLSPVSVVRQGENWVVDFGKCLTGWPELKLHANQAGDSVKVQYWEVEQGWGDAGYDSYLCAGGEETFKAPYVRHTSFRLLEISGYSGELTADDVRGIVAYSSVDKQGNFSSSDSRLNAVYEMCERSGRQNIQQGIISVDANREQSPWTADSWNIGVGCLYNHKDTMLIDKVIKDYAGEQLESGNFLTCSPAKDYHSEMAEWSLYWPMLLWEQYLFSGDAKLLSDYYPNLTKFLDYIERSRNPGTGLYNPPGWRASDYAGGSLENGGENIATNSQIYQVLEIAAQISQLVGQDADAQSYSQAAAELKNAVNRNLLVDGRKYRTTSSSGQIHPLGTAWALRSGIVPAAFEQRVIEWFASQKGNYDVGGYGGDALYNGLYQAGLGKIATEDYARYDQMLEKNNTNWESFGALSPDNMGNHAWTAYPSYLLPKYVGGVQPTSGGFATFDVKPVTGGLTWAETTVPTARGEIRTRWESLDEEHLTLNVTVPANTVAKIYLPDNDMDSLTVTEGGTPVFADGVFLPGVDGLHDGALTQGYVVFTAGSGEYSFAVSGNPLHTPDPGEEQPETGIILDDNQAVFEGNWVYETASNHNDRYGDGFRYSPWVSGEPTARATYSATVEQAGRYSVYAWWGTHPNRATDTPYTIRCGDRVETVRVNQEVNGGQWNLLGTYDVPEGGTVTVEITNDANEYVIADAVRIAPYEETQPDTYTPFQQLQLTVYEMEKADTGNCTRPSVLAAFQQALRDAQALCSQQEPEEQEVLRVLDALKAAYQEVLDHQRDNLALGKSVSASEEVRANGLWGCEYLTDGFKAKDNSARIGYTTKDYTSPDLETPIDITIDLGTPQTIREVVLTPRLSAVSWEGKTANFPRDYEIQLSDDGVQFRTVCAVTDQQDPQLAPVSCRIDPTQARFVRLHVTRLGEYAGDEGLIDNPTPYRLQLAEIEVFSDPAYCQVEVSYNPEGGSVEGDTELPEGEQASLTACPNPGWVFRGWYSGDTLLSKESTYRFTAATGLSLTALFEQEEPTPTGSDKTILERVLAYAQQAREGGEYAGAIPSVKTSFDAAYSEAQRVYMDQGADQESVDRAWMALMTEIHKLGFQAGQKQQLETILEFANGLDLERYVQSGQPEFQQALAQANACLADADALQGEVDEAVEALLDAMANLRFKADKSLLKAVLAEASTIDLSLYTVQSAAAFNKANQVAKEVDLREDASQQEVDAAVSNLSAAIGALTAIPDTPKTGSGPATEQNGSARTGDASASAAAVALFTLTGAAIVLWRKKQ